MALLHSYSVQVSQSLLLKILQNITNTCVGYIHFSGWLVNYTILLFSWWPVKSILEIMRTESFFENMWVWKTSGRSAHVSTPYECGQETVKWGNEVEMPVSNPANGPLRPLHTPVPPSSPPIMPGILRTHSEKGKQLWSKKNRLWWVAAMCRLSACQPLFFFFQKT